MHPLYQPLQLLLLLTFDYVIEVLKHYVYWSGNKVMGDPQICKDGQGQGRVGVWGRVAQGQRGRTEGKGCQGDEVLGVGVGETTSGVGG